MIPLSACVVGAVALSNASVENLISGNFSPQWPLGMESQESLLKTKFGQNTANTSCFHQTSHIVESTMMWKPTQGDLQLVDTTRDLTLEHSKWPSNTSLRGRGGCKSGDLDSGAPAPGSCKDNNAATIPGDTGTSTGGHWHWSPGKCHNQDNLSHQLVSASQPAGVILPVSTGRHHTSHHYYRARDLDLES